MSTAAAAEMRRVGEPAAPARADRGVSVSLRTLVLIRWVAVIGQAATLVIIRYGLGFALPVRGTFLVVGVSAVLNIAVVLPRRPTTRLGDREAAFYLAYDTLQLGMLLFLTGGLQNPFSILMLAPVTVSATILSRSSVIGLSVLTIAAIVILAVLHLPLPSRGDASLEPQPLYVLGVWTALVGSTVFITGYAWSVAEEARRMRDAFAATQLALAREQRISALGGLAAAAAHQLGSPLATIAVVAKELVRDLPAGSPYTEDAQLLLSQSERCRTILADLAHQRDGDQEHFDLLPFTALVAAAGEPHRNAAAEILYISGAGRDAEGRAIEEPVVKRSPEIMHGLGNLIQNAGQFARREVAVTTSWSEDTMAVDIVDDGPGFSQPVLARIGEPYISGRDADEAQQHMGLGIFIAQSLLERTGARLSFANLPDGGGQVVVEWSRATLDAGGATPPMKEAKE
jgi:two-component system sensor histidine kinase RegB